MAKKKKKKEVVKTNNNQYRAFLLKVLRVFAIIFCSLIIYALIIDNSDLSSDINLINQKIEVDGFWSIFNGDLALNNNVGLLGASVGYGLSWLAGHYLVMIFMLGFIIKNLISLFGDKKSDLRHNITLIMGFFFFIQLLLANFFMQAPLVVNGIIAKAINQGLIVIIGSKGTTAFLIITLILDILLIFGWDPVKTTFIAVGKALLFPFFRKNEEDDDSDEGYDPEIKADRRDKQEILSQDSAKHKQEEKSPEIAINNHQDFIKDSEDPLEDSPSFNKKDKSKASKEDDDNFKINQFEQAKLVSVKRPKASVIEGEMGQTEKYVKPNIDKFLKIDKRITDYDKNEIEANIKRTSIILKEKLAEFGIEAEVVNVNIGPIITQYELKPAPGVKVNKFTSYADDLGLALKATSIRIQAPIPGRGLVGIEIPNKHRDIIYLKEIMLSEEMQKNDSKLAIGLGKDISGRAVVADLAKMPHLLIAGATGSGKSVCINTIILNLLVRTTPDEVRMILIDPKRVELAGYGSIPHLWTDVVTDPEEVLETFKWAVEEMERRYGQLQELKVREMASYNKKVEKLNSKLKKDESPEYEKMPYIVIIVDEFADLIMTAGKEIEVPITRLAQMARAVGMHIILATQRPSMKVITGVIKANFPARIAFQVSSRVDSRVILDEMGAEKLLGKGDMLFVPPGTSKIQRIHGAYVSDNEINEIIEYLETQPKPAFRMEKIVTNPEDAEAFDYDDDLFVEAARLVVTSDVASVSMLQRSFKIGYARAGRLIDMLEQANIVGPHKGSKSREVIASLEDLKIYGIE
jgi:S-DNA-T family DNA segregation ATPase FtsK/SpoIIIE